MPFKKLSLQQMAAVDETVRDAVARFEIPASVLQTTAYVEVVKPVAAPPRRYTSSSHPAPHASGPAFIFGVPPGLPSPILYAKKLEP